MVRTGWMIYRDDIVEKEYVDKTQQKALLLRQNRDNDNNTKF